MFALLALLLTGCDSSSAEEDGEAFITVSFQSPDYSAGKTGGMPITGSNGVLNIDHMAFVVSEFELRADGDGCFFGRLDEDCHEFDVDPRLVTFNMDGNAVPIASEKVPAGTYRAIEFEIEDLDLDDGGLSASLRNNVRAQYPDWPDEASLLVTGTFTSTGGVQRPFRSYFEADVEVERVFATPVNVAESEALYIRVDPGPWFREDNQTVVDLSLYDYTTTGEVADLDVEIEDGLSEVEIDD